jgi:cell wall-associated NlpC family hydrolase
VAVTEAPARAEDRAHARTRIHPVPTLLVVSLALLMLGSIAPVAARGGHGSRDSGSQADRVIAAVTRYIGAPYRWGSTGPRAFDCSGLVYRAFKEAHLVRHIGGFNTAHGYYQSFQRRGRTSTTGGQPGDIVVYAHGGHVGIYLGHGKVISALLSGVRRHGLKSLGIPFTTFIHLGLTRGGSSAASSHAASRVYLRADRRLPMRARASRHARVLLTIARDRRLRVVATSGHGTWTRVRLSSGRTGWVRTSLTRRA